MGLTPTLPGERTETILDELGAGLGSHRVAVVVVFPPVLLGRVLWAWLKANGLRASKGKQVERVNF